MNGDEANKCINIAKTAISNGDYEKAIRFLQKSLKLHETGEAHGLIKVCEMNLKSRNAGKTNGGNSNASAPTGTAYKRAAKAEPTEDKPKNYTSEQVKVCSDVLKKTNYYEILGVDKKANENDIKKAYRKLALRLHPDKNNAPKATDAFKKVSVSYACLSDTEKRHVYDLHGTEDNFRQTNRQHFRYEDNFDPFEFFDMFTGGGFGNQMNRRRRPQQPQRREQQNGQQQGNQMGNLMPLFILLMLSLLMNMGSFLVTSPAYSFAKTSDFRHKLSTEFHNIDYYVDADTYNSINQSYKATATIEQTVETDFYNMHKKACRQNQEYKNHWNRQANYYSKGSFR
jgi:curved DNA-binding protein CbpA